jgi:hypothetical protein
VIKINRKICRSKFPNTSRLSSIRNTTALGKCTADTALVDGDHIEGEEETERQQGPNRGLNVQDFMQDEELEKQLAEERKDIKI